MLSSDDGTRFAASKVSPHGLERSIVDLPVRVHIGCSRLLRTDLRFISYVCGVPINNWTGAVKTVHYKDIVKV